MPAVELPTDILRRSPEEASRRIALELLAEAHAACKRLEEHEHAGCALPSVLVVDSPGATRSRRHWRLDVFNELLGGLVHTDDRALWVVRLLVKVEHVFHAGNELAHPSLGRLQTPVFG